MYVLCAIKSPCSKFPNPAYLTRFPLFEHVSCFPHAVSAPPFSRRHVVPTLTLAPPHTLRTHLACWCLLFVLIRQGLVTIILSSVSIRILPDIFPGGASLPQLESVTAPHGAKNISTNKKCELYICGAKSANTGNGATKRRDIE